MLLRALRFLLPLVLYALFAWHYAHVGLWNADEGFYLVAARRVASGALPYRDFGYSQMPLLPYLNGAVMALTGFALVAQRLVNALWGALTVLTAVGVANRRHGPNAGALAGLIVVLSPHWVALTALGKTYAATGLFLTIASVAVTARTHPRGATTLFAVAGAAAIGCRLSALPVVVALGLGALIVQAKGAPSRAALAYALVLAAVCIAPFAVCAPESFLFWVIRYHGASARSARGVAMVADLFWLAPAVMCLVLAAVGGLIARSDLRRTSATMVLLAGVTGQLFHLVLPGTYAEYSTPLVPLLALGAVGVLADVLPAASRLRWGACVLPALALLHPLPSVMPDLVRRIHEASEALRRRTVPGTLVLTPLPYIAIEAGRDVVPGTEMGMFSVTNEMDEATAQRLHLVTNAHVMSMVQGGEAGAVVLVGWQSPWNFTWSVPSLQPMPESFIAGMYAAVGRGYRLVSRSPNIVVFVRR